MASELSRSIATRMLVAKSQGKFDQEYSGAMELIRPEIDAELQEVREVLEGLHDDGCYDSCWERWGKKLGDDQFHSEACQRARELMKRLEVK